MYHLQVDDWGEWHSEGSFRSLANAKTAASAFPQNNWRVLDDRNRVVFSHDGQAAITADAGFEMSRLQRRAIWISEADNRLAQRQHMVAVYERLRRNIGVDWQFKKDQPKKVDWRKEGF